jgi:hypothetical protein
MQYIKLFCIYLFDHNIEIPVLDKNFITTVMGVITSRSASCRKVTTNEDLFIRLNDFYETTYKPLLYEENKERVSSTRIGDCLDYSAKQLETCYKNNIVMNYHNYVARYINRTFRDLHFEDGVTPKLNTHMSKEEKSALYKELREVKDDIFLYRWGDFQSHPKYHERLYQIYEWIVPEINYYDRKDSGTYYDIKVNPFRYLRCMIDLNKRFEHLGIALYNPLCLRTSCVPKYIKIDSTVLKTLFFDSNDIKTMARKYGFPNLQNKRQLRGSLSKMKGVTIPKGAKDKDLYDFNRKCWKQIFRFGTNKANKSLLQQGDYAFGNSILTDGVGVSVMQIRKDLAGTDLTSEGKKKKKGSEENDHDDNEEEIPYLDDLNKEAHKDIRENTVIVGCDPGKKVILMMTDGEKCLQYTRPQRALECRFKKNATARLRMKQNQYVVIHDEQTLETPEALERSLLYNGKSCDYARMQEYIREKQRFNWLVGDVYNKEVWRKLRFSAKSHTQQSEDLLMERILETYYLPDKDICLCVGDWSSKCRVQLRHSPPTPNIGILRRLKTKFEMYKINEYKTSCTCHFCLGRTDYCKEKTYTKKTKGGEEEERTIKVHGLLCCTNKSCNKYWNRDVNASKNILLLAEMITWGKKRPMAFQKSP